MKFGFGLSRPLSSGKFYVTLMNRLVELFVYVILCYNDTTYESEAIKTDRTILHCVSD